MTDLDVSRPKPEEHSAEIANYISLVPDGRLYETLGLQADLIAQLTGGLSDDAALVRHAPYTWSVKQVVGHLIDCERIFGYRTLRLARNDATPLPGFDENAYMLQQDFDRCLIAELLKEFLSLRKSHLLMLRQFSSDAWDRRGTVNGHALSTRAAAYVLAGHAEHHLRILRTRLGG
jgi:hypothetical protein